MGLCYITFPTATAVQRIRSPPLIFFSLFLKVVNIAGKGGNCDISPITQNFRSKIQTWGKKSRSNCCSESTNTASTDSFSCSDSFKSAKEVSSNFQDIVVCFFSLFPISGPRIHSGVPNNKILFPDRANNSKFEGFITHKQCCKIQHSPDTYTCSLTLHGAWNMTGK